MDNHNSQILNTENYKNSTWTPTKNRGWSETASIQFL